MTATGWAWGNGFGTCADEEKADRLQKLDVGTRMMPELCKNKVGERGNREYVDDFFCAVDPGLRNTCCGDSGGGLVGLHEGRYHLFVTLSFGEDCARQEQSLRQNKTKAYVQVFTSV